MVIRPERDIRFSMGRYILATFPDFQLFIASWSVQHLLDLKSRWSSRVVRFEPFGAGRILDCRAY